MMVDKSINKKILLCDHDLEGALKNCKKMIDEFGEVTTSPFSVYITANMNDFYEKAILKAPTQYFWMHRRFKNRPEGEEGFYPYWKKREERREKERKKKA